MVHAKLILAACVLSLLTLAGCSKKVTARDVRDDPTPEIHTTAMTEAEHDNSKARAIDHTMRQIWDDLDKLLLINEPSRLSEYQIP